LYLWYNGLAS